MKKVRPTATDELRAEYRHSDFGNLVRRKYAPRVAAQINVVVLEPEVAKAFPNDNAVNEALRGLLDVAATTARLTRRSTGHAKQRRAGKLRALSL